MLGTDNLINRPSTKMNTIYEFLIKKEKGLTYLKPFEIFALFSYSFA